MYIREASITVDLTKDECFELAQGMKMRLLESFRGTYKVMNVDGVLKDKQYKERIEMMYQLYYYSGYRYLTTEFEVEARKILEEKVEK